MRCSEASDGRVENAGATHPLLRYDAADERSAPSPAWLLTELRIQPIESTRYGVHSPERDSSITRYAAQPLPNGRGCGFYDDIRVDWARALDALSDLGADVRVSYDMSPRVCKGVAVSSTVGVLDDISVHPTLRTGKSVDSNGTFVFRCAKSTL